MIQNNYKHIPDNEFAIGFSRSSGPGGQNVNKRDTKAELRWNVGTSTAFTPEQKEKIKRHLAGRINNDGEVVIQAQTERSQLQNKEQVVALLYELVEEALRPVKRRVPTRPTRASRERRLGEKKLRSEQKKRRSEISE